MKKIISLATIGLGLTFSINAYAVENLDNTNSKADFFKVELTNIDVNVDFRVKCPVPPTGQTAYWFMVFPSFPLNKVKWSDFSESFGFADKEDCDLIVYNESDSSAKIIGKATLTLDQKNLDNSNIAINITDPEYSKIVSVSTDPTNGQQVITFTELGNN